MSKFNVGDEVYRTVSLSANEGRPWQGVITSIDSDGDLSFDQYAPWAYSGMYELVDKTHAKSDEVRITDPETGGVRQPGSILWDETAQIVENAETGGKKGQKVVRPELIPWEAIAELGFVYGEGAKKYGDNNWRKGYDYSLSIGAMKRHILKFEAGQDYDAEGFHHMAAVMFHAAALIYFQANNKGTDTRGGDQ